MASTYENNLRLNEMGTGDQSGTWGQVTNTNLDLIGEAFSYQTEATFTSDGAKTATIGDGVSDKYRAMYIKVTCDGSTTLSATQTLNIAPNTVSKMFIIENATTGGQAISVSQGSGANVTIANGTAKEVFTAGGGTGAIVYDGFDKIDLGANAKLGGNTFVTTASADTLTNKSIDSANNTITNIVNADIKSDAAIDATKIADGTISNAEFQYLNGVSSNIQSQLDGKGDITAVVAGQNLTGGATSGSATLAVASSPTFGGTVTAAAFSGPISTTSTVQGNLIHNSSSGFYGASSSTVNRAPDVLKRDIRLASTGGTVTGYNWHVLGTNTRSGFNGTGTSGSYIYLPAGTWYITGDCQLSRVASDTADTTYMFLATSTSPNSHLIDGTGNAIGDWSTTFFKAEGTVTLSSAAYIGIRFYAAESVSYGYVSSYYSNQYLSFAYLAAWKMY